jgi:hypothetical protein
MSEKSSYSLSTDNILKWTCEVQLLYQADGLRLIICSCYLRERSRDSSVGIATGYGLDNGGVGVRVPVGPRIFSSPRRPDGFWGPNSLLLYG